MKLTKKNVMKFLKQLQNRPCKEGMKALKRLFKQKQSMEFVFNKMSNLRTYDNEVDYAYWMCAQMCIVLRYPAPNRWVACAAPSFKNFKFLFNMLPDVS